MTIQAIPPSQTKQDIQNWLVVWIANELQMPQGDINLGHSLLQYSMSSVTATILVGDLEDWLDLRLPPTLVWDYPTIEAIADYLVSLAADAPTSGAGTLAGSGDLLDELEGMSDAEVDALLRKLS